MEADANDSQKSNLSFNRILTITNIVRSKMYIRIRCLCTLLTGKQNNCSCILNYHPYTKNIFLEEFKRFCS